MTYPPQQPGPPGPHGQDPYGQQQPGGQQGQPGQFGQQPGQYGQYGQQQPGPYGQAGQQPGQYGQQPGYPGGGPPKKKTGLIIAIVVAVLVLAGGGLTIFLLNQDDEPSNTADRTGQQDPPADEDPTEEDPGDEAPSGGGSAEDLTAVAQEYIEAVMAEDEPAATALVCGGTSPGVFFESIAGDNELSLGQAEVLDETSGTIEIIIGTQPPLPTPMSFEDGKWCVTL